MKREYITKKEDLKDKYIKMPSNLSKKKWDKIKLKLGRLGFENFEYCEYCDLYIYADQCLFIWKDGSIGIWCEAYALEQITNPKVISIKDFLAEPKEEYDGYFSIEEIKESENGIYIKGKINNYNPHLKIAGIEIPYHPICPIEEETYTIEENNLKIIVPNEYHLVKYDMCCVPYFCGCCGKNTRIQVSKGDDWVCPHCLDGEQKESDNIILSGGMLKTDEDIWKEFDNGLEALDWCIKNPMSVISYRYEDNDIKEYVRYNDELKTFQRQRLEDTEWKRLYKYNSLYGDVMIELLHRWKNISIDTVIDPDCAEC